MLKTCDNIWGGTELRDETPAVEKHYDLLFIPWTHNIWFEHDPNWGVYGADGRLVDAAAHRRGVELQLCGQSLATPTDIAGVRERVVDETLVYGGPLIPHYGHFLCSTLSRLWLVARDGLAGRRVLFHATANVRQEFASHAFFRDCLGALGLGLENVVVLQRPTRLDRLIIPRPSFVEQNYVAHDYGRVTGRIGAALGVAEGGGRAPPAYLTKTGMSGGVTGVRDEAVIEERLRRAGVEIIHPERLSIVDQARLFGQRRVIAGFAGSQFHTCVFAPAYSRHVVLAASPLLISNFVLFDKLRGQAARYVYPENGACEVKNEDGFLTRINFDDPAQVADQLLDAIREEDALFA